MSRKPTRLTDFTGECRPSGTQLCYRVCPVCGSDEWKVYVSPETGLWKCFAGRHNGGGKVDVGLPADAYGQSVHLLERLALSRDCEPLIWEELELPAFEPLTRIARLYLRRRGVDEDLQRRLGLVEWADKFRILIPYFDRAGNLIYWNSRRYSDDLGHGPKYLTAPGKHPLYELRQREPAKVVLVEGVFDAIAAYRAGYHAIALGGKSLPRYLEAQLLTLTEGCGIINVMLDSDALAASLKIRDQLADKREVRIVPCPAGTDPGAMSPEEIKELIR